MAMQNRHDATNDDSEDCDLEQENIIVKIRYIFEMKERVILVDRVGIVECSKLLFMKTRLVVFLLVLLPR